MHEAIAPILGQIPSGLSILTARNAAGDQTGMLASWVQQAAFDPPSITVAINKQRYVRSWLGTGVTVALSLVGETQKQLLGHFGKGFEPGAPAFTGLSTTESPAGVTVLSESIGWLEGKVAAVLDAGDHSVYLVELTAAGAGPLLGKERPWLHVRKSGAHY